MGDTTKNDLKLVPLTGADVSPEWLSFILNKKISSQNFEVTGNVHAGTGFLSDMLRITCESEDEKEEDSGENKKYSFVVKLLPDGSSELAAQGRDVMIKEALDNTEIKFYTVTLPHLLEELPELGKYFCGFLAGHIVENPRGSVIILQDLKPLGYRTFSFAENISREMLEDAVKFLAKFHFAANAVEHNKGVPLSELYDFLQYQDNQTGSEESFFYTCCVDGIGKLDKFLESQKVSEEMQNAYKKFIPKRHHVIPKVYSAQKRCGTLIHGDLWSNNVLYHEKGERPMIAIDWQLLAYGDAMADLAVLLSSSLPPDQLTVENTDKLLRLYYDTFCGLCKEKGLEVLITRDYEAASKFFYTYAMGFILFWYSFSPYPFQNNYPRLLRIYEFLYKDVDVFSFFDTL